jgi:pilus assembly protein CpaF
MFAITVTEKGGEQRRLDFDKSQVTIGRVQGNDVILPKGNVSKRHARIVVKDGKFILVDLKSTNGTYVNGRKITSPLVVKETDKIYIGDFILGVTEVGTSAVVPSAPEPTAPPERAASQPAPPPPSIPEAAAPPPRPRPVSAPPPIGPAGPGPVNSPPPPQPAASSAPPPMSSPPPPVSTPAPVATAPQPPPPSPPPPISTPRSTERGPRLVGRGAPSAATGSSPAQSRPTRPHSVEQRRPVVIEPLDPEIRQLLDVQRSILDRIVPDFSLDKLAPDRLGDEDLWQRAEGAIIDLVETMDASGNLPENINQDHLIKETLNEALGLGPLEDLLADEAISEIIVDRRDRILISKHGVVTGAQKAFSSDETFRRVVERLVAPTGHTIDEENPFIDIKLRDGSRLAAAVPPVAVRGACLTLRKTNAVTYSLADLIAKKAMSPNISDFLQTCVGARQNIVVCGAPSSGKTAVLSALAAAAPVGERIVSVEEVAELSLDRDDWIGLEARPGDGNGLADVDMEQLLRGALRMRPDRLVVADVRGPEALELVSAMASSNDGALASVAGDSPAASLARLTAMARLSSPGTSVEALRELIAYAVDVIVHVARYADGVFRVAQVAEVTGANERGFEIREVFSFRGEEGGFAASGVVPAFYTGLEARGMPADTSIFQS